MNFPYKDRRRQQTHGGMENTPASNIVRQGISLQASLGTVSAIEFLKANGISSSVIQRVLTGTSVRAEDILGQPHDKQPASA